MRKTQLTPMLLSNLECFTLDEIIKIMKIEPKGFGHQKVKNGRLADSRPTSCLHFDMLSK
jgi:hypothetical protein